MSRNPETQPMWSRQVSIADSDRGSARIFSFDLIRAFAILLVILAHTLPIPSAGAVNQFVWSLTNNSDVIFFMLSGALLLPVNGGYGKFLKRRIVRIFVPFIVWSAIYILLEYNDGGSTAYWTIHRLKWSWLMKTFSVGWFVPVMMGIYLIMPILSPWIATASRRRLLYFLGIWLFAGLTPWLLIFCDFEPTATFFGLFYNYAGFAVAGYYLSRFPLTAASSSRSCRSGIVGFYFRHRSVLLITGFAALGIVFPIYITNFPGHQDVLPKLTTSLSFSSIGLGCLYFLLLSHVRTLGRTLDWIVKFVARNVYGVYLCHFFVMDYIVLRLFPTLSGSYALIPVVAVAALLLSALLRRIPLLRTLLT